MFVYLVPRDELVRECEPGHEPTLLEPEDGAEGSREEDALDDGECDQTLGKALGLLDPLERPVGLLGNTRHRLERIEESLLLRAILDVRVDQEAVRLRMNILHRDLKPIEATSLRQLHLRAEALAEVLCRQDKMPVRSGKDRSVTSGQNALSERDENNENNYLVDDAVRRRKESEHVGDKVLLVGGELLPIDLVVGEVDLLSRPEARLSLLVHLPHPRVFDRKENKPARRERRGESQRVCARGTGGGWLDEGACSPDRPSLGSSANTSRVGRQGRALPRLVLSEDGLIRLIARLRVGVETHGSAHGTGRGRAVSSRRTQRRGQRARQRESVSTPDTRFDLWTRRQKNYGFVLVGKFSLHQVAVR